MLFSKFSSHFSTAFRTYCVGIEQCLSDVKVLDLSRIMAGPFCTMLLSDLGAKVIKVEKLGKGDDTRSWNPPSINGHSAYFLSINRNKKSIALNFKHPKGIEIIQKLASTCDVVVENFIPGKLDKLGLGYSALKQFNKGLIYCSISGFGPNGPWSSRAGYDVVAASLGGLLSITGSENGEFCKVGVPVTDLFTGMYAKGAILAALHQRSKTKRGCKIDCNLLSSQIAMLVNVGTAYLNTGIVPFPRGTAHDIVVPYQSFKCSDNKWVTIGAGSDTMFAKLCKILFSEKKAESMIKNPKFLNNSQRVENRKELTEIISNEIIKKSSKEWESILLKSGVAFGEINRLDEVFSLDQVHHNNGIIEVNHPKIGTIKLLGPPVKYQMENEEHYVRGKILPPPLLGEHTEEILRELGYNSSEIEQLTNDKIIQCT